MNNGSTRDILLFTSECSLLGLAMWTDEVLTIELQKTERGLGFSILDYQDPLNPSETVMVIRSLVPGGVAQQDGKITMGGKIFYKRPNIFKIITQIKYCIILITKKICKLSYDL